MLNLESAQKFAEEVDEGLNVIVDVWLVGLAKADHIECEDAVVFCEGQDDLSPNRRWPGCRSRERGRRVGPMPTS